MATVPSPEIHRIEATFQAHDDGMRRAQEDELAALAQRAARLMKRKAPKFRTGLTNSVIAQRRTPQEWDIGPTAAHALAQEKGRKPGKGLPRFFDPKAADLVAWLESKAFKSNRSALGSAPFRDRELALRDRYMALSRHAKFKGLRATPFVEPTAREMEPVFRQRMQAVTVRYTQGGRP